MTTDKIIYIAGYGRSGSTILSIVLDSHPEIASIGEVANLLPKWSKAQRLCACGRTYARCDFWRPLFPESAPSPEMVTTVRKVESFRFLPWLVRNRTSGQDRQIYRRYHEKLFSYVRKTTGKRIVVDASKSAWLTTGRFLALQNIVNENVYVIHLVRNGLATLESQVLRGRNRDLEDKSANSKGSALRTILGWGVANASVSLLSRKLPAGHYLLLRYEDFVADPPKALAEIGDLGGVDLTEIGKAARQGKQFSTGHLVAGNRLRFDERVTLRRNIERPSPSGLAVNDRVLFMVLGRWLNRHYGYS